MISDDLAVNQQGTQSAEAVLTKAFLNAADLLELSGNDVAELLGVSEATYSRLRRDEDRNVERGTKQWELAACFVRIFRSLDAMVGGDVDKARAWFAAPNHHLGGTPAELVKTIGGIIHVAQYLDAMRGRI